MAHELVVKIGRATKVCLQCNELSRFSATVFLFMFNVRYIGESERFRFNTAVLLSFFSMLYCVTVGIIPYSAVYDTQDVARRRGYWIPGVPVYAHITEVRRDPKFGLHLINAYLYVSKNLVFPFKFFDLNYCVRSLIVRLRRSFI